MHFCVLLYCFLVCIECYFYYFYFFFYYLFLLSISFFFFDMDHWSDTNKWMNEWIHCCSYVPNLLVICEQFKNIWLTLREHGVEVYSEYITLGLKKLDRCCYQTRKWFNDYLSVWIQYKNVTDRQTDGHRPTTDTALTHSVAW